MARSRSKRSTRTKERGSRLKALPWAALLRVAMVAGERWRSLSARDRARLSELVRGSRGRLGNLSSRERDELRKLLRKLDPKSLAGEVVSLVRGSGRRRKR